MQTFLRALFLLVRGVSIVTGLTKGLFALAALAELSLGVMGRELAWIQFAIASSPVTVITCLVLGQWAGEAADAAFYRREGGEGPFARLLMVQRLRFMRSLHGRPLRKQRTTGRSTCPRMILEIGK